MRTDRVFYETLIEQNPNSEMAQEWCLAYGILSWERANKLNIVVCKRKGKSVASVASPAAGAAGKGKAQNNTKASKPVAAAGRGKKRVIDEDDIIGDTGFGASSAWEGVGVSGV